jgi:hypothetical protein
MSGSKKQVKSKRERLDRISTMESPLPFSSFPLFSHFSP